MAFEIHCQQAPSATPGLVAKLVAAGKYDPAASKSLGALPVILVTEQDCFYRWSGIKAPQLAMAVEAELFFCWTDTEGSGGLLLWLFFPCNGFTGVLSLQHHTPAHAGQEYGNKCFLEQQCAHSAASQPLQ